MIESYTEDVIIPHVYNTEKDRIDTEFIIMDFIKGDTCYNVPEQHKKKVFELIYQFAFTTAYFSKVYHTDLHPGNIICVIENDEPKIGIIDFGMHMAATDEIREFSFGFMNSLILIDNNINNNITEEVDVLKFCTTITVPPIELKALNADQCKDLNATIIILLTSVINGTLGEKSFHLAIDAIRKTIKINNIQLSADMIKYAMGLSMVMSSTRLLVKDDKEVSFIAKRALRKVMSY